LGALVVAFLLLVVPVAGSVFVVKRVVDDATNKIAGTLGVNDGSFEPSPR